MNIEQITAELARLRLAYGELLMRCTLECQEYEQHAAAVNLTLCLHRQTQAQLAITAAQLRDMQAALQERIKAGELEMDAADWWRHQ